jgi:hypothetical protein
MRRAGAPDVWNQKEALLFLKKRSKKLLLIAGLFPLIAKAPSK